MTSHHGRAYPGPGEEPDVPTSRAQQSCAFCGTGRDVAWAHPLDPERVEFRAWGKGFTLPWFWAVCAGCEQLVAAGDDAGLLAAMLDRGHGDSDDDDSDDDDSDVGDGDGDGDDDGELERASLAAFRRADLGARPLGP